MKRFHVHVSVSNLSQSIRFYSSLFGAEPARVEPDYAKWLLDDPRLNFAISTRDSSLGVNHIGLQVDSAEELAGLEAKLKRASTSVLPEAEVTCCYAVSDKYWVTDPQGIAWEVFHTLQDAPVYGDYKPIAAIRESTETSCCGPRASTEALRSRRTWMRTGGATIRPTRNAEVLAVREVLSSASLPVEDVTDSPRLQFWVAQVDGSIVGVVGLERVGQSALLRSLAVVPPFQSRGLGQHLVEYVEQYARTEGYRELTLLTTSADRFFEGLGYLQVERESVPEDVQQTAQFRSLCPSSAICMTKSL